MADSGTKITIAETDRVAAMKGAALLERAASFDQVGIYLATPNGEQTSVALTTKIRDALRTVLTSLGENDEIVLLNPQAELSPEQAAKILGISRPLVYQRMDDDRLPFREVGSHRRILVSDVMALKVFEGQKRKAAKELAADTDDIEAAYARSSQSSP